MENKDKRSYPINAIRVCVDEYDRDIKGRIYSKMCETPLLFNNCSEMFLRADKLFDDCGYPQSFQEKRNFQGSESTAHYGRPRICHSDEEILSCFGIFRTIDILVESRRRAGWQGVILKSDGKIAADFQSEMELLRYLGISKGGAE